MTNEKIRERYAPGRRENSFFMDARKSSKKLKSRVSARVRKIPRITYYIDSNGCLVSE